MNRALFLPVLFVILTIIKNETLNAQYIPIVEESKYWIYYDFQHRPRPTTGFLITILGDTIVENTLYKKVYKYELRGETKTINHNEPPTFVPDFPYFLIDKELISLIREDTSEKVVYNLPIKLDSCLDDGQNIINPCNDIIFCDTLEHLLFDFSLSPGDTLNYCSYAPLHYQSHIEPEKVDSIKLEMSFGKLRKTFYTYGVPSYLPNLDEPGPRPPGQVKIIEGIGFQNQGIFNYRYGSLVDFCEGNFENCDIISATKELDVSESEIKIYPNPATDFITIESTVKYKGISLVNTSAINVFRFVNVNKINLNGLPSGMYICCFELENGGVLYKRLIKINR